MKRRSLNGTQRLFIVFICWDFYQALPTWESVVPSIAVSRRQTPRLSVPVGSVGIAGRQTGIYPLTGPGGWQLIGRTPVMVIDLGPPMAFVFHPGDKVQFEAVSSEVFDNLSTAV